MRFGGRSQVGVGRVQHGGHRGDLVLRTLVADGHGQQPEAGATRVHDANVPAGPAQLVTPRTDCIGRLLGLRLRESAPSW